MRFVGVFFLLGLVAAAASTLSGQNRLPPDAPRPIEAADGLVERQWLASLGPRFENFTCTEDDVGGRTSQAAVPHTKRGHRCPKERGKVSLREIRFAAELSQLVQAPQTHLSGKRSWCTALQLRGSPVSRRRRGGPE